MNPARRRLTLIALLLALSGCGSSSTAALHHVPGASPGDTGSSPNPTASTHAAGPGSSTRKPTPGATRPGPGYLLTPGSGHSTPAGSTSPAAVSRDNGGVGEMSRAFLRPAPYQSVTVEFDVGGAAAPDPSVTANLLSVLRAETKKPVSQTGHNFAGKGSGCWSYDDLVATTNQERRVYSQAPSAALFVMFLDGSYCPDTAGTTTLGLAYAGSDIAIFTKSVENASISPTVGPTPYMKAATVHELGHILGLVNLGYQSTISHEDPQHAHHSSNPSSVMYYAIDSGDVFQQFVSGPPQAYDSDDEADLAALRSGAY